MRKVNKITIKEMSIFAMLGAIMYMSKILMEWLPNVHLLGMLTMTYTLVFRKKALIPIYVYVFVNGLLAGFSLWWVPYLYIWTILWGVTMLLPQKMSNKMKTVVYMTVCGLHGMLFGILYSPAQAILFGLSFKGMIAWIVAGFYFDLIHCIGNCFASLLIIPLTSLLNSVKYKL